jgi:protein-disulfide isomerase
MNKKILFFGVIILTFLILTTLSVVKKSLQITIEPNQKPLIENNLTELPVKEDGPMFGNPGAPTTVTEFFSFECPECNKIHEEIIAFIKKNPGQARLMIKEVAKENWLGNINILPVIALNCANEQNKYWEFLDKTMSLKKIDENILRQVASEINLEMTVFNNCLQKEETKIKVKAEQNELKISGLTQTPLIFIDNRKINLTEDTPLTEVLRGASLK